MSAATTHPTGTTTARTRAVPPVDKLAVVSLALAVVGGIYMATYAPRRPPLAFPTVVVVLAGLLAVWNWITVLRLRHFARDVFVRVAKWTLLAYVVSAGMIEYVFVKDHTRGAPLVLLTLMLVLFATNVPAIVAFTVARYQRVDEGAGSVRLGQDAHTQ
jgi:hypothetical protein